MSNRSRVILIGGLFGAVVGALVGWIYSELAEEEKPAGLARPSRSGLRFQGSSGDLIKLGFAVIPLIRLITDLFAPAEED